MKQRIIKAEIHELQTMKTTIVDRLPRTSMEAFSVGHLMEEGAMITIPSGLGGHFSLNYHGSEKGVMVFQVINPGYNHWIYQIPMA